MMPFGTLFIIKYSLSDQYTLPTGVSTPGFPPLPVLLHKVPNKKHKSFTLEYMIRHQTYMHNSNGLNEEVYTSAVHNSHGINAINLENNSINVQKSIQLYSIHKAFNSILSRTVLEIMCMYTYIRQLKSTLNLTYYIVYQILSSLRNYK